MKIEEKTDKEVSELDLLTQNLAALTAAVQTQNDVLLCLLHNFDLVHDTPMWVSKEALEEDVKPKVQACIEAVRNAYGQFKTDKS